ncbi:MAG: alpha/beta hydrolase-fold protein [Bacteroidetes bacterium]|nr:alpha/beta hydrolase-fold protein [Bacteroidota bacterium]
MKKIREQFILSLLPALLLIHINVMFAQSDRTDFTIGDKVHIESKVLNERKTIVVITPFNYKDNPDQKYPVVYVLDPGNNLFGAFGIENYYSEMLKIMPRSIIVGIVSKDREKDYLPVPDKEYPTGGGAGNFLQFFSSELVPYIDSAYPATSERCIIGHSAGGLFAVYALLNQPELFTSFICIDPSLWYENQSCLKRLPDFFAKNKDIKKSMFISLSNEKDMGVFPFMEALEKYAPEGFRWDFVRYKDETHNSLGFKSMCAGFEMIYKNWKP